MIKNPKLKKIAGIGAVVLVPVLFLIVFELGDHKFHALPIYGEKIAQGPGDTLYHEVPKFMFTNQFGEPYGSKQLDGKLMVVNFIFTRCPSICPDMTSKMLRLQWKLEMLDDPSIEDVKFVSLSVDPEHDTPEVLKEFAYKRFSGEVDHDRWNFLTGDKEAIYRLGSEGLYLAASEDVLAPGGFLHSEKFVLVDRDRHIRGYYNGTSIEEVDGLVDDIKLVLKEEKIKAAMAEENK